MEKNSSSERVPDRRFSVEACIVSGCTDPVEAGHFMCGSHWISLPREMQQQFYRARHKYEKRFEGGEQLLNAVMQTCAEHVEQVIADTAGNIDGATAGR